MRAYAMFAVAVLGIGVAVTGGATVQRTFVASTGSDSHPCSLAQPCRGFAAALTQTSSGGEIVVLDSAGYGRVTINKSVTIAAPPGVHAGVTVFGGTNGIDIPAGGIKVVLRGLAITGQGGTDGIYVSGDNELTIERCDIGGMSGSGIHLDGVSGSVQIRDTVVHDNAGNGILLFGTLSATLDHVDVERNTLTGLIAIEGAQVLARGGTFARNNRGVEIESFSVPAGFTGEAIAISDSNNEGLKATMTGSYVLVSLVHSVVTHNPSGGVVFSATGSGHAWAVVTDNTFARNASSIATGSSPAGSIAMTFARNTVGDFDTGEAGETGLFFRSGGGNVITVGGAIVFVDQTTSF